MNTKCISTRLKKEQAALIEQLAKDRNILVADWYKEALQEKANKQLKKGNPHAKEVRLR